MIRLLALLAALSIACTAPSQHDETRFGRVTVGFGPSFDGMLDWRADQLVELRAELSTLSALGPTFTEASEGTAQIVVRPFDSGPGCALGAARWTPGTSFIEIDYTSPCTNGFTELRAAMGHEIGHVIGLTHICFTAGELPTCSPVGVGSAMMNPKLSYGDVFTSDGPNDIATEVPTDLDLAEYRRVHP